MGEMMKNKIGVCQMPPTLKKRENWLQKSWTVIMSVNTQTKAAYLQLTAAALYLFIGAASFSANEIIEIILFASDGTYLVSWDTDTVFLTLLSVTIIPLVISAVGLKFFYGLWMKSLKSWAGSLLLNIIEILMILITFGPVLTIVNITYMDPSPPRGFFRQIESHAILWGILVYLVPFAVILSLTLALYLSAKFPSVVSTSRQVREFNALRQSNGIRRRRR